MLRTPDDRSLSRPPREQCYHGRAVGGRFRVSERGPSRRVELTLDGAAASLRRLRPLLGPVLVSRKAPHEANLSAESDSPPPGARLPGPDEDQERTGRHQATPRQGTQATRRRHAQQVAVTGRTGPFRRSDRLLRSKEFQHVSRHGRRAVVRGFVVLAAPRGGESGGAGARLGVTVSRRVGGAVVRNRVKRRIRDWFRCERDRLAAVDLVVIGRRAAAPLSCSETTEQLGRAARELAVTGS